MEFSSVQFSSCVVKTRLCVADLSLVISLGEDSDSDVQLSYEHSLTIQSPSISLDVDSCLELLFTAQSQFHVKLACVAFDGVYSDRPPLFITLIVRLCLQHDAVERVHLPIFVVNSSEILFTAESQFLVKLARVAFERTTC